MEERLSRLTVLGRRLAAGCWLLALEGRGLSRPEEGGNAVKGIAGVGQGP